MDEPRTQCSRCGKYTLFPPLCAECEKNDQRARGRADAPAPTEPADLSSELVKGDVKGPPAAIPKDLLEVAAKQFGMSAEALNRKLQKGGMSVTTKVTVMRSDGTMTTTTSQRGAGYDELLRFENARQASVATTRKVIRVLIVLAVLYLLVRPMVRWFFN